MAILFKDRVKDTSTTTGTGDFTLSGSAPSGFQTFNSAYSTGSGNQFYYCIDGGAEWEVGISYLSASTTLERGGVQTVLASNTGSAVSFSAGTKTVFSTLVARSAPIGEVLTSAINLNNDDVLGDALTVTVFPGSYVLTVSCVNDASACVAALLKTDFGGTATVGNLGGFWRVTKGGDYTFNDTHAVTAAATDTIFNVTEAVAYAHFQGGLEITAAGTFTWRVAQDGAESNDFFINRGATMSLIPV